MADGSHRVAARRRRPWPWLLAVLAVLAPVVVVVVLELRGTAEPTPWASAVTRGTDLTVEYVGSECRDEAAVEVEEGSDRVVVTVRERVGASSCSDVGVLYTLRERLDAPLGDRTLVDGACLTEEWRDRPACLAAPRG